MDYFIVVKLTPNLSFCQINLFGIELKITEFALGRIAINKSLLTADWGNVQNERSASPDELGYFPPNVLLIKLILFERFIRLGNVNARRDSSLGIQRLLNPFLPFYVTKALCWLMLMVLLLVMLLLFC